MTFRPRGEVTLRLCHQRMSENRSSYDPVWQNNPTDVWFWAVRTILLVVSLLGNGLVVVLIVKRSRLHTSPNWIICSLAIADLLVTVAIGTTEMLCTLNYCTFSCNWWILNVFYDMAVIASVFNLCALTYDRFLAIVHPLKYQLVMTRTRVFILLLFAWGTAIAAPLPSFASHLLGDYKSYRAFQILFLFFCEFLPSVLLLVAYVTMANIARRQVVRIERYRKALKFNNLHRCSVTKAPFRVQKINSNVQIIGILVFIFNLCFLLAVYKGVINYVFFKPVSPAVISITRILYHFNSAANGLVYAIFKTEYKQEIKRLLGVWSGAKCKPWMSCAV
ncbi:predicted protein [Nematostella vectensis]|uniref:G-protein coupled receptors family 1 profile domain-containing protein n=1 Tax=Nematostella vectensis TaxID=45351 RepID=A7RZJ2_NEMVE|nr:octopamine receptor beta-1R [Nematostella vectensis]EDO43104.1 predicted protein [Nematostella vectensis]|eukprot:XP_001635167.1 predicted protein [Nematostella vectensis]